MHANIYWPTVSGFVAWRWKYPVSRSRKEKNLDKGNILSAITGSARYDGNKEVSISLAVPSGCILLHMVEWEPSTLWKYECKKLAHAFPRKNMWTRLLFGIKCRHIRDNNGPPVSPHNVKLFMAEAFHQSQKYVSHRHRVHSWAVCRLREPVSWQGWRYDLMISEKVCNFMHLKV